LRRDAKWTLASLNGGSARRGRGDLPRRHDQNQAAWRRIRGQFAHFDVALSWGISAWNLRYRLRLLKGSAQASVKLSRAQ
jgi:hypothetical protein